jgi:hypothetical protein
MAGKFLAVIHSAAVCLTDERPKRDDHCYHYLVASLASRR